VRAGSKTWANRQNSDRDFLLILRINLNKDFSEAGGRGRAGGRAGGRARAGECWRTPGHVKGKGRQILE